MFSLLLLMKNPVLLTSGDAHKQRERVRSMKTWEVGFGAELEKFPSARNRLQLTTARLSPFWCLESGGTSILIFPYF